MAGRTQGADKSNCPACGLPVVTQWVGRTAALKVTADAEPIPYAEAVLLSEPNRLAWCLVQLHGGGVELR